MRNPAAVRRPMSPVSDNPPVSEPPISKSPRAKEQEEGDVVASLSEKSASGRSHTERDKLLHDASESEQVLVYEALSY